MALEIEAIYERGTLKLPGELPLQEGQKVKITIQEVGSAVDRLYGMLKWTGSPQELDSLLGPDNHPWAREE
ncbi:MAG TPA: antitoxin family protein [Gemmataceae bacterium]|jgi:predicted DNA-binding antitoxin AbrB/MazE fold protein